MDYMIFIVRAWSSACVHTMDLGFESHPPHSLLLPAATPLCWCQGDYSARIIIRYFYTILVFSQCPDNVLWPCWRQQMLLLSASDVSNLMPQTWSWCPVFVMSRSQKVTHTRTHTWTALIHLWKPSNTHTHTNCIDLLVKIITHTHE